MRIEMNNAGQMTYNSGMPMYGHKDLTVVPEARRTERLPMLDWPTNLFSSAAAMADESASYQ